MSHCAVVMIREKPWASWFTQSDYYDSRVEAQYWIDKNWPAEKIFSAKIVELP